MKDYKTPTIEIIYFDGEDVIRTSDLNHGGAEPGDDKGSFGF